MIKYKVTENTKELSEILKLQAENLQNNLTEEIKNHA